MKKTVLAALGVALSLTAGLSSCTDKGTANTPAGTSPVATEPQTSTLNIRYIDGDSIAAAYNLAKDYQEVSLRAMSALQRLRDQRGGEIERFAQQVQEKARANGYLTETSYNADMTKLARMQQDAENAMAAKQRTTEQELAQLQQALNDSIDNFIRDYNARKGYDAILYRAAGVYFNPSLDITAEVIEGLNARYNKIPEASK